MDFTFHCDEDDDWKTEEPSLEPHLVRDHLHLRLRELLQLDTLEQLEHPGPVLGEVGGVHPGDPHTASNLNDENEILSCHKYSL